LEDPTWRCLCLDERNGLTKPGFPVKCIRIDIWLVEPDSRKAIVDRFLHLPNVIPAALLWTPKLPLLLEVLLPVNLNQRIVIYKVYIESWE
jgi:hypothetical protein